MVIRFGEAKIRKFEVYQEVIVGQPASEIPPNLPEGVKKLIFLPSLR
jgi:hypothetical protein